MQMFLVQQDFFHIQHIFRVQRIFFPSMQIFLVQQYFFHIQHIFRVQRIFFPFNAICFSSSRLFSFNAEYFSFNDVLYSSWSKKLFPSFLCAHFSIPSLNV
jgi:hypothetical protein